MNVVRSESKTVLLDPSANAEYKNGHPAAMIAAIENESENYFDLVVNCSITEAMEARTLKKDLLKMIFFHKTCQLHFLKSYLM